MFPIWETSGGKRDLSQALEEIWNRHRLGEGHFGRRNQPRHLHRGWRKWHGWELGGQAGQTGAVVSSLEATATVQMSLIR